MPMKPPVPCRGSPVCPNPGPYCDEHRGMRKAGERQRASAQDRGYDSRWQKVRRRYLRREPLCEPCKREGRVTVADMVDHTIPIRAGGEPYDPRNLESMCWPCHGKKTEQDKAKYLDVYQEPTR